QQARPAVTPTTRSTHPTPGHSSATPARHPQKHHHGSAPPSQNPPPTPCTYPPHRTRAAHPATPPATPPHHARNRTRTPHHTSAATSAHAEQTRQLQCQPYMRTYTRNSSGNITRSGDVVDQCN